MAACPYCQRETLEFLTDAETLEVIGCTECTTTAASFDEQYMVDTPDGTFLQCPHCGSICDTLYADKRSPEYVDGCENCMLWIDSYEEE